MSRVRVMLSMLVAALAAIGGFSIGRVGTQGGTEPAPGSSPVTPPRPWYPRQHLFPLGEFTPQSTSADPGPEEWIGAMGHSWEPDGRWFEAREVAPGNQRRWETPFLLANGRVVPPAVVPPAASGAKDCEEPPRAGERSPHR